VAKKRGKELLSTEKGKSLRKREYGVERRKTSRDFYIGAEKSCSRGGGERTLVILAGWNEAKGHELIL